MRFIRLALKDCEKKGGNMDMEQVRIKRGIIRAYLPPKERKPKEDSGENSGEQKSVGKKRGRKPKEGAK